MNVYAQRLLDVARSCRESKRPDMFDMHSEVHGSCGTPACAMGHYAARIDLQSLYTIARRYDGPFVMLVNGQPSGCFWEENPTLGYFGITEEEGIELFYSNGCGEAKTPNQAADYIERFVARKWPEPKINFARELEQKLLAHPLELASTCSR